MPGFFRFFVSVNSTIDSYIRVVEKGPSDSLQILRFPVVSCDILAALGLIVEHERIYDGFGKIHKQVPRITLYTLITHYL
jgi:hypothetical protein